MYPLVVCECFDATATQISHNFSDELEHKHSYTQGIPDALASVIAHLKREDKLTMSVERAHHVQVHTLWFECILNIWDVCFVCICEAFHCEVNIWFGFSCCASCLHLGLLRIREAYPEADANSAR